MKKYTYPACKTVDVTEDHILIQNGYYIYFL